eukprot:7056403-Prymnesium_polylepis.1
MVLCLLAGAVAYAPPPARLRAIFSDIDGTLVHYANSFEAHGVRIVSSNEQAKSAVVVSAGGERRDCRLVQSSTMGLSVVSERKIALVDALRAEGIRFSVVTAARKSTMLQRWPLLPECDAHVCESGGRVYLGSDLDRGFSDRFDRMAGDLETALNPDERPEPLWRFYRSLVHMTNLKRDA